VFEAAHRAAGLRDSLVITIDDFQWSDQRSTALVHDRACGAEADGDPLALVVGGRRSTAVSALVASLERLLGDRLTRVTLGPLNHHSTVELARSVNPAPDPRAAAAVADRSGGSPFWCELLAEARDVDASASGRTARSRRSGFFIDYRVDLFVRHVLDTKMVKDPNHAEVVADRGTP
jgi:hypothetical protein